MLYSIICCCEVDKYSTSLFICQKAVLDFLDHQSDQIYGRSPASKIRLLQGSNGSMIGFDVGINIFSEDLVGNANQRDGTITFGIFKGLIGFGTATIRKRLHTSEILNWCMQRKAQNQNFVTSPAWSTSSENMWFGSGDSPGFTFWRATANSVKVKS